MRRLTLAVMIVLLPLRGWIGDVMAMEAVTITNSAIHSIADYGPLTMGLIHSDENSDRLDLGTVPSHCPDHASLPGDSSNPDGEPAAHGLACTVCQVCHTVAMSTDAATLPALPLPALAPEMPFPSFTSALPAPGLKPPIS